MWSLIAFALTFGDPQLVSVPADEFEQQLKRGGVLIDVRTPAEFVEHRLEGALLMDFTQPDFKKRLEALDRDKTYLIYCRSGGRSGRTLTLMQEAGFQSVFEMSGGILAWIKASKPVVTGDSQAH